jgi:hypothetical protein
MVTKAQLDAQNIVIEELRGLVVKLQDKVAELEKKQQSLEEKSISKICETSTWAKVLSKNVKKNEYQTNVLNAVGNEQKARNDKQRSVMVFGLPASKASSAEEKQKEDENKVSNLFNSLNLGKNFYAQQVERVYRFKSHDDSSKIAPIQVTVKLDGACHPLYTATDIAKAAKCLKDNSEFRSVYINPDLTQSQQIYLKNLIKERTRKNSSLDLTTSEFRYGIRGDQVVKIKNII